MNRNVMNEKKYKENYDSNLTKAITETRGHNQSRLSSQMIPVSVAQLPRSMLYFIIFLKYSCHKN